MFFEQSLKIDDENEILKLKDFLQNLDLKLPEGIDYGVGIYYQRNLVGVGFLCGEIIQGVGILPQYQGEGLTAKITTHLIKKAILSGKEHLFLFTKPTKSPMFQGVGFKKIADAKPYVSLLEWGSPDIEDFKACLRKVSRDKPEGAASIVINANPFTLGHRYLVETVSKGNPWVYVLVVEENLSAIPFDVRFRLVKEGLKDLTNVTVIESGKYVISSATFPSYFTKDEDLAKAHTALDLEVFSKHIAPSLKVNKRYVGSEPYCKVTSMYNENMKRILPKKNIEIIEIPRIGTNGEVISASRVRKLLLDNKIENIKDLVPVTTYDYFKSEEGKSLVLNISKK